MQPLRQTAQDVRFLWALARDPRFQAIAGAAIGLIAIGSVVFWFLEGWPPLDAVYFSVMTLTTIGYGDVVPATAVGAFEAEFGNVVVDPDDARQFPLFGSALLYIFAMRMAAIFVTSTIGIVRGSGIFPRWFQVLSYVAAACLFLVASRGLWLAFVFPAWILLLSALIVFRRQSIASFAGVALPATDSAR